jgi:ketosteroid isomerase-like protein
MTADVRAFFEQYRDAFNALDGEAIAQRYAVPSGLATDRGYTHWSSLESIRANMTELCRRYRDNGYVSATFEPAAFIAQGANFAIADVKWHIERAAGAEPWQFHTTYNLRRTLAGWRITLATAYEEEPPTP